MPSSNKRTQIIRKIFLYIFLLLVVSTLFSISYFGFLPQDEKGFINNLNASYIDYSPEISTSYVQNPYIGFVTDARTIPSLYTVKLVYAKISWTELEPIKGQYDFNEFEKKNNFEYWREQGVNIIIRFYMDQPEDYRHMNIPDWLYYEINADGTFYNSKDRQGFSPNYSNTTLINEHKLAISALAKRYDNDDLITFVELGSIGHWGEWHTTSVDEEILPFPKTIITDQYVQDYIDNFKNKLLMMRRPFAIARTNKFGLFNDSFGDILQTEEYFLDWINKGYLDKNTNENHPSMQDFWKKAPSGGEFGYYPGKQYISEEQFERTIKQLEDSHISWLGPSAPIYGTISDIEKANLDIILNKMGYRFSVKKATLKTNTPVGGNFDGTIKILNSGIAPFYFDWNMKFKIANMNNEVLLDENIDYDVKNILPGEKDINFGFLLENQYYSGIYSTYFSIKNAQENYELNLANNNFIKGKGLFCGEIVINLSNGLSTDSFKYNNYYNYINYVDNIIKLKAFNTTKSEQKNDLIKFFRTKKTNENFKINYDFSTISKEIKSINFFVGENTLLTIENFENEIKLIAKDYEKVIGKESFSKISLNIKKEKNNYSIIYKSDNNIEEKINNIKIISESFTHDFGSNISLLTEDVLETTVGVLEFE